MYEEAISTLREGLRRQMLEVIRMQNADDFLASDSLFRNIIEDLYALADKAYEIRHAMRKEFRDALD